MKIARSSSGGNLLRLSMIILFIPFPRFYFPGLTIPFSFSRDPCPDKSYHLKQLFIHPQISLIIPRVWINATVNGDRACFHPASLLNPTLRVPSRCFCAPASPPAEPVPSLG